MLSPQGDRVVFSASVFQVCGSDLSCTKRKLDEKKNSKASGVVFGTVVCTPLGYLE